MFISKIPTYIIHLKERMDRQLHILKEFENKPEFDIHLIHPVMHDQPRVSLWLTVRGIIKEADGNELPYVLICEDDHQFTSKYTQKKLFEMIKYAEQNEIGVLSGGVSWFKHAIELKEDVFWVNQFTGLQFTVIFKSLYQKILMGNFEPNDVADMKLSALAKHNLVIYPYISVQKEFGYSDVTSRNEKKGFVQKLFKDSASKFSLLKKVRKHYKSLVIL